MVRSGMVDIHRFAAQYVRAEARLRASSLSAENQRLVLAFRDACLVRQACGQVRLIRVLSVLGQLGILLGKDFAAVTREDLEHTLGSLLARGLKPATMSTYKAIIKRFFCWLHQPDEFPRTRTIPPVVAWLTSHLRRQDATRLQRNDLLTPDDIEHLIAPAT